MFFRHHLLRRLIIFFSLFITLLSSSGCNSGQDTNETLYTSLIGIDKSEDGKICVSYQFEDLKKDDEGSENSSSGIKVISIESSDFYQSIDFLTSIVSRTPSFAHVRAVVFGEELAREGVYQFISVLLRFNEFRSNTYVLVVKDATAREFIAKNKPTIESSASKYIETQMSLSKYANIFLKSNIHEFYNRLKSNSAAPYAALGGINGENEEPDNPWEPDLFSRGDINDIYAGQITRKGSVNPCEIAGTALFRRDKMIGVLNSRETLIASIFKKDFERFIIRVQDPYAPGHQVGVEFKLKRHPEIEVSPENGNLKININLDFICFLSNIPSGIPYEEKELRENLETVLGAYMVQEIKAMLEKTQNIGADIIGFGYQARTKFRTYPEFMDVKWDELYSQAEFDIKVNTKIENNGLLIRSTPISPR